MKKTILLYLVIPGILMISLYISTGIYAQTEPKQNKDEAPAEDIRQVPSANSSIKIGDIEFIYVPAGTFTMGSREVTAKNDELPPHEVFLDSFLISKCEITQTQYRNIMEKNPSRAEIKDPDPDKLPVDSVTWYDASEFCRKFGLKYGVTARLPYEAEWEYAARAGTQTVYFWGSEPDPRYCWFRENSKLRMHPVGEKLPNARGIHDISGNLWEWCMDWYDENYYKTSPKNNPQGPAEGQYKILRGGSWESQKYSLRSANRQRTRPEDYGDDAGFRMVVQIKK